MRFFQQIKYKGKKIKGYTIKEVVGEGKYGLCFTAVNDCGQTVIIKKFKPHMFRKNAEMNEKEAVVLSALSHERIPELLGVINEKSFYAFVIELKPGITIHDMIFKEKHQFSKEEIYSIGIQLIAIIKYLHEQGVVHRDIRTPNVLLNNNEVYVIDFGLARFADNDKYKYDLDYSYLADLLLYLVYSSFSKEKNKKLPWYEELDLTAGQKLFLKRLFGLEDVYKSIYEIETDFIHAFER